MPGRTPIAAAEATLRDLVGSGDHVAVPPSVDHVMGAIKRFGSMEFDVSDLPDADGFLFQYGNFKWLANPGFVVGFVRQFEEVDAAGEHDCYIQLQCEFTYSISPELESIAGKEDWWFRGEREPFETWFARCSSDPVWNLVRDLKPLQFTIAQGSV